MAVSMQEKFGQLKLLDRLKLLDKVIQNFGFENKKTIFFAKVVENFTLCDLEQMAEEDTFLPNELKDIAIFLALNGKTLTFEE